MDTYSNNKTHAMDMAQAAAYLQYLTKQKEDLYKSVFDSVSDAILIINCEGKIEELNAAAHELFVDSSSSSLSRGGLFSDVLQGQDGFKFSLTVDRCIRLNCETSFRAIQKTLKDKERHFQVNVRPIQVGPNNGALIVIKDSTKKVLNERVLRQAKLKAESSDLAKTQFLANISHEVRTPMNIIMGYASLMGDSKLSQKDKELFIDRILNSSKSLMSLLDKALEVGSGSEVVNLKKSDFALFPAIKKMMKNWPSGRLEVNLDFKMPLNQRVHTDRERLLQALSNLMDNAMKFTKKGSVELIVEETNGRVSFCVADTGIGVSRDQWKRLFSPFTQADESFTRDFGGSGLGLAVVKHLSELLGGGARVKESAPGLGSVFEIWVEAILIKNSYKKPGLQEKPHAKRENKFPNLTHAKILLVEDVEENRFLIKHYLREIQCRVDTAFDGKDALVKLKENSYDLILMDLQMPRLDGYGATHLIRKKGLEVPIIALTAHSLKKDIEKCRAAGFNGHLSKPVAQSQLLSKVHKALCKTH